MGERVEDACNSEEWSSLYPGREETFVADRLGGHPGHHLAEGVSTPTTGLTRKC